MKIKIDCDCGNTIVTNRKVVDCLQCGMIYTITQTQGDVTKLMMSALANRKPPTKWRDKRRKS